MTKLLPYWYANLRVKPLWKKWGNKICLREISKDSSLKQNTKSTKVFRLLDGSFSRDVVRYICPCQIWHNLMILIGCYKVLPWAPILAKHFLMDFSLARRKREGINDKLFFSTTFSHPKEIFVDHLRILKESTFRMLLKQIGYSHWAYPSSYNLWVLSTSLHKLGVIHYYHFYV